MGVMLMMFIDIGLVVFLLHRRNFLRVLRSWHISIFVCAVGTLFFWRSDRFSGSGMGWSVLEAWLFLLLQLINCVVVLVFCMRDQIYPHDYFLGFFEFRLAPLISNRERS